MSASWEIVNQQRVLVVILTTEVTSMAWSFGFKNLVIPGSFTGLSGMPFGHARNTGCMKLLEIGWEWLFFLDSDVIPPPDAILRLVAHKQPIVSGLYYRRNNPLAPVMLRNTPQGRTWVVDYKVPDLMEVDFVGSGCLLIHRDVLLAMPPVLPNTNANRWFEWTVDRDDLPQQDRMSEDFKFCERARNLGCKILVDTSIQCKHCGYSESKAPGALTPLELM
jgi:hypothetical protein